MEAWDRGGLFVSHAGATVGHAAMKVEERIVAETPPSQLPPPAPELPQAFIALNVAPTPDWLGPIFAHLDKIEGELADLRLEVATITLSKLVTQAWQWFVGLFQ